MYPHSLGHQAGIGVLARRTGLSKAHISKIFNGARKPSLKVARRLSEALEISLDELYDHLYDQQDDGRAA
jgi:transcriptional regulator with XRE-family HTH domain